MILVLKSDLKEKSIENIYHSLKKLGLNYLIAPTSQQKLIVIQDDTRSIPTHVFSQLDGVEKILRIHAPCPLVSDTNKLVIKFGNIEIGSNNIPVVIAGPCSIEGRNQIVEIAHEVKHAGAQMLRGGAFKPRTSPYDFNGLGKEGLEYLLEAKKETNLPVVSEVMSAKQVEEAEPYIDMYQIGARNMYNYELLKEVGRATKPVLLKRAMTATISEFLQAAEYILLEGNMQVILCERGIRTFETYTRNTLDLSAVAALKSMSQLPVLVDPSHGTGRPELISPMSKASIACGADGLLIEVHSEPSKALSDGSQAITPMQLANIVKEINIVYAALNDKTAFSTTNKLAPTLSAV